ncbi:hypothetical protein U1763_02800 [Sphingomonas sp. LB2R24]|uniref:hypothetical protein n=1 Tax=Sphingomonas sorbitolis TaxID=3096165 RepID=UPI002FCC8871
MNGKVMRPELAFAAIRQGDLTAAEGWELISRFAVTEDRKVAERLCDSLRVWTWKALDRRRRDDGLKEWVDVLNRVEAFVADRFDELAIRLQTLSDLLHDSLGAVDMVDTPGLLQRKHVPVIVAALSASTGEWIERSTLMGRVGLKAANMTRLMGLLADVGWVEQIPQGREIAYRLSTEGMKQSNVCIASFRNEQEADPQPDGLELPHDYLDQFVFGSSLISHQPFTVEKGSVDRTYALELGKLHEIGFTSIQERRRSNLPAHAPILGGHQSMIASLR